MPSPPQAFLEIRRISAEKSWERRGRLKRKESDCEQEFG